MKKNIRNIFILITLLITMPFELFAKDKLFTDPASVVPKTPEEYQYKINELSVNLPAYFILSAYINSVALQFSKEGSNVTKLNLFNTIDGWKSTSGLIISDGQSAVGLIIDFTTGDIFEMPKNNIEKFSSQFSFRDALYINALHFRDKPDIYANVIVVDAAGNYSSSELKYLPKINKSSRSKRKVSKTQSKIPLLSTGDNLRKNRADIIVLDREIITAAATGQRDRLNKLLASSIDINEIDTVSGDNALIRAIESGYLEIALILIDNDININHYNRAGQSALHVAAGLGLSDISKILIQSGIDVNKKDNDGNPPILYAALSPNTDLIDIFLQNGGNINDTNNLGQTPLMVASIAGNTNTISKLILDGADINATNNNNDTALMKAIEYRNNNSVALLLESGLEPNIKNKTGLTPLHMAMASEDIPLINLLIKHGADINIQNADGNTPLMVAAINGNTELVEELLKHSPDLLIANRYDQSVFNISTESNQRNIQILLSDAIKQTLIISAELFEAVSKDDIVRTSVLIKRGAGIDPIDDLTGNTPLFVAILNNYKDMTNKLIELGADINIRNNIGNTPLIVAIRSSNSNIIEAVLKANPNINIANNDGDTPLIFAIKRNQKDITQKLLLAGADPNQKNNNGLSAFTIARNENRTDILPLLKTLGGID